MPEEVWLPVLGFPGYEASDQGNIRSVDRVVVARDGKRYRRRGVQLSPQLWRGKTGRPGKRRPGRSTYRTVRISTTPGRARTIKIARLVLLAHVGPPPFPGADARHLDDDSMNDQLSNLAWGTRKENEADKRRNGNNPAGERHGLATLTDADIAAIREAVGAGASQQDVADQFKVSQPTISRIVSRKRWGHV